MIGFDSAAFRRGFWRGVLAGFVAGLILALLLAPRSATAAPIAVASDPSGATVTLHDEAGICPEGSLLAVWQSADKRRAVLGCWVASPDRTVRIVYLDGDSGVVRWSSLRSPA